ncbi:MAG: hypothetical protein EA397_03750, partial [Deltaproteobacteria bacterium]
MISRPKLAIWLLTIFVFFGATLLFGVEPLVGRLLLPYFGGAVHVWLTCLVVFQGLLLLGYAWAHFVAPRLGFWHLLLLLAGLLFLPLDLVANVAADAPVVEVSLSVLRAIGLPFLALSTVSVVAQSWYARSSLNLPGQPYPLYAASNAGSLLALLAYPFIVEPLLGTTSQRWIWTVAYASFIALGVTTWLVARPHPARAAAEIEPSTEGDHERPGWGRVGWWLTLSALPSAFLLATTNVIASEVGSFPLVWVIPLALYLASFMMVFREKGGAPAWLIAAWPEMLVIGAVLFVVGIPNLFAALLCALILFGFSIVLHKELYLLRPHTRYLTSFYLWMSVGGFVGGSLVTYVAPFIFRGVWEYPIILVISAIVMVLIRGRKDLENIVNTWIVARVGRISLIALGLLTATYHGLLARPENTQLLDSYRNFYGVFRVYDHLHERGQVQIRQIIHGSTLHGVQLIDPEPSLEPTAYYHPSQCIAEVYNQKVSPKKVGIVGLGAGALAGFGEHGDQIDFFEIDPDNEQLARKWFTFLDESPAEVSVYVGDGRLLLLEHDEKYDLLQMDAFSGDGIPAHLINLEALRVYRQRLNEDGLLLLHISNRYYDLHAVIKATAAIDNWSGAFIQRDQGDDPLAIRSMCVVLATESSSLDALIEEGWRPFGP